MRTMMLSHAVLLLLKSCDRASHDLDGAWNAVGGGSTQLPKPQPMLVLREYFDLLPHMEFRCFVKSHRVIAISQRDVTSLFPELQGLEDDIADAVMSFHEQHVGNSFALADCRSLCRYSAVIHHYYFSFPLLLTFLLLRLQLQLLLLLL